MKNLYFIRDDAGYRGMVAITEDEAKQITLPPGFRLEVSDSADLPPSFELNNAVHRERQSK